jgi:protein-L-isoaspartate(D-aspartate) O-methyltransferase
MNRRSLIWIAGAMLLSASCARAAPDERPPDAPKRPTDKPPKTAPAADAMSKRRARLIDKLSRDRSLDAAVLEALRAVPRHELVPEDVRHAAYDDRPLPIGWEQTISQPTVVALMTTVARVKKGSRVLEIGTGSGYQAAVLAQLGAEVYSIEILKPLGERAAKDLARLGYKVTTRIGDGYVGWPEAAPFDAVIVTAAPPYVPEPLKQQLKVGGRLVLPVGQARGPQNLLVITRTDDGFEEENVAPVAFVPMTGEAQKPRNEK